MSRRPKAFAGGNGDDPAPEGKTEELFRVCSTGDRAIINGHVLPTGTVIELTANEIDQQRAGGVALEDVHAEDKRDVYSVREMFVAKDSEGE